MLINRYSIFQIINQLKITKKMSIFDILVFLLIIVALHLFKAKYPNFLFFCKGAVLFLPPIEQQDKSKQQSKLKQRYQRSQKKDNQFQVTVVNIQYQHVKQYSLGSDYDRASIVILAVLIFLVIKIFLARIIGLEGILFGGTSQSSNFLFFVSIISFTYVLKIGIEIFWVSSYNIKICLLVSLGINALFFILNFTLGSLQVYDQALVFHTQDYARHLEVLLGAQVKFITNYSILICILTVNFVLTLVIIPTVIKFGNWYAKTVKQIYYEDQQAKKEPKKVEAQKQLKKTSKKVIRYLNLHMFLSLGFIVLSHRSVQQYIDQSTVDILRSLVLLISLGIICNNLKQAIEFNGSFAYQFVTKYYASQDPNQRLGLRVKIASYIKHIWYHIFQFMFRVIVPLLLFCIIIDWKYLANQTQSYKLADKIPRTSLQINGNINQNVINYNVQCEVSTNPIQAIESLYRQSAKDIDLEKSETFFINGKLLTDNKHLSLAKIQKRVNQYGISWQPFFVQSLQTLFWYFNTSLWGLTIVYILFLRKTVYDI